MGAVGQRMTKTVPQPTDNKQNGGGEAAFDVSFHGTVMVLPPGNPPSALFDVRGNCEVCHTDQRTMSTGTTPPPKTAAQLLEYVSKIKNATKAAVYANPGSRERPTKTPTARRRSAEQRAGQSQHDSDRSAAWVCIIAASPERQSVAARRNRAIA